MMLSGLGGSFVSFLGKDQKEALGLEIEACMIATTAQAELEESYMEDPNL